MAKLRVLGENPPPPRGNGENQLRELRDYLTRLKDELEFLLTHLGEDNLDGDLAGYLRQIRTNTGEISEIEGDVSEIEGDISDINTALAGKQDTLTFDDAPTSGSSNPVKSGGVYTALSGKQNTLTFDNSPTSGSSNPVKSGGVYTALAGKQNTLTFDDSPTSGSSNPVKSGGIYTALSGKQNTLTFDNSPTSGSSNPVKSGGIYTALQGKADAATEIVTVDLGTISSLPATKSNAAIKAGHVVIGWELGSAKAQLDDWTVTTSAGSLTISGNIFGSTTLKLVLGLPGTSIT